VPEIQYVFCAPNISGERGNAPVLDVAAVSLARLTESFALSRCLVLHHRELQTDLAARPVTNNAVLTTAGGV
jgi:hypothetical protein